MLRAGALLAPPDRFGLAEPVVPPDHFCPAGRRPFLAHHACRRRRVQAAARYRPWAWIEAARPVREEHVDLLGLDQRRHLARAVSRVHHGRPGPVRARPVVRGGASPRRAPRGRRERAKFESAAGAAFRATHARDPAALGDRCHDVTRCAGKREAPAEIRFLCHSFALQKSQSSPVFRPFLSRFFGAEKSFIIICPA